MLLITFVTGQRNVVLLCQVNSCNRLHFLKPDPRLLLLLLLLLLIVIVVCLPFLFLLFSSSLVRPSAVVTSGVAFCCRGPSSRI